MLVFPHGECFIKEMDSLGEINFGSYIAPIINDVITKVGADNVMQVVMDNAKNYKVAGRILEQHYPQLYNFGCNTHSLNLVLQDWYKSNDSEWFGEIINNAKKVVKLVLKRQRLLDMYRQQMSTMLKLPCETRFCTNFYMVESLLWNKNAVLETFVCAYFSEWEATQTTTIKGKVVRLRVLIVNQKFWDEVGDVYHVMMHIMLSL